MKLEVFTIHDSKAGLFLQPWVHQSVGSATRQLEDMLRDPSSAFAMHPEDYSLFHLGAFDQVNGKFELKGAPEVVAPFVALVPELPALKSFSGGLPLREDLESPELENEE